MKCQNTNLETKKEEQNGKLTPNFKCQNFILIYLKIKRIDLYPVTCTLEHKTGRRHKSHNTFKWPFLCHVPALDRRVNWDLRGFSPKSIQLVLMFNTWYQPNKWDPKSQTKGDLVRSGRPWCAVFFFALFPILIFFFLKKKSAPFLVEQQKEAQVPLLNCKVKVI